MELTITKIISKLLKLYQKLAKKYSDGSFVSLIKNRNKKKR